MNNKLNNMLKDFFENNNVKDIDEANEKLQEFIQKYNNNEMEYEATDLDKAYDILNEAQNSKSKKQAKNWQRKHTKYVQIALMQFPLKQA